MKFAEHKHPAELTLHVMRSSDIISYLVFNGQVELNLKGVGIASLTPETLSTEFDAVLIKVHLRILKSIYFLEKWYKKQL